MSEPQRVQGRWVGVAVALICAWEGFQAVGWHDPIDPKGVNTVCYGHIEDVQIGERHTKIECQEMLAEDLPRYEAMVKKCIHVAMPDYRHAAIISFTYNVGGGALCKSSVARKLNAGDVQGGCDALLLYNRANGKVIKGLQNRREAERKLCLRSDNAPSNTTVADNRPAQSSKNAERPRPTLVSDKPAERPTTVQPLEASKPDGTREAVSKFWHEKILGW